MITPKKKRKVVTEQPGKCGRAAMSALCVSLMACYHACSPMPSRPATETTLATSASMVVVAPVDLAALCCSESNAGSGKAGAAGSARAGSGTWSRGQSRCCRRALASIAGAARTVTVRRRIRRRAPRLRRSGYATTCTASANDMSAATATLAAAASASSASCCAWRPMLSMMSREQRVAEVATCSVAGTAGGANSTVRLGCSEGAEADGVGLVRRVGSAGGGAGDGK